MQSATRIYHLKYVQISIVRRRRRRLFPYWVCVGVFFPYRTWLLPLRRWLFPYRSRLFQQRVYARSLFPYRTALLPLRMWLFPERSRLFPQRVCTEVYSRIGPRCSRYACGYSRIGVGCSRNGFTPNFIPISPLLHFYS